MRVTAQSRSVTHTVDCILFGYDENGLAVLLVSRGVPPFAGSWVLPGGAMDDTNTLESTARRVLSEMVGIENGYMKQVATYSDPDRHPVRRVITTTFYGLVHPDHHQPVPRLHLREARWTPIVEVPKLGFDHERLLKDARRQLVFDLEHSRLAFELLPDRFTLTEVQQLYEAILGRELDRPNFRRKLLNYDFLVRTPERKVGVRGGPNLYRVDRDSMRSR